MVIYKVPQKLLDVACHDTQLNVKESALNVLRSFCKHEKAKKVTFFVNIFKLGVIRIKGSLLSLGFNYYTLKKIALSFFKILKDVDAIDKLSSINFLSPSNTDLNSSSSKNNYLAAAYTCKNIINCLKS